MKRRVRQKRSDRTEMVKDSRSAEDPQEQFDHLVEQFNALTKDAEESGVQVIGMLYSNDPLTDDEMVAWFTSANMPTSIGLAAMLSDNINSLRSSVQYTRETFDDDEHDINA